MSILHGVVNDYAGLALPERRRGGWRGLASFAVLRTCFMEIGEESPLRWSLAAFFRCMGGMRPERLREQASAWHPALGLRLSYGYYSAMLVEVLAFAGCALMFAKIVYRYDLFDPEPIPLILLAVALGAAAGWLVATPEAMLAGLVSRRFDWYVALPLAAALCEDSLKLAIVAGLALACRRWFQDPLDGLIYGTYVGLGMAIEESVHYWSDGKLAMESAGSGLIRMAGHIVFGGIVAFPLGLPLVRPPIRRNLIAAAFVGCVALALLLHFAWDYNAFRPGAAENYATPVAVLLMVTGLVAYRLLVVTGARYSKIHFARSSKSPAL